MLAVMPALKWMMMSRVAATDRAGRRVQPIVEDNLKNDVRRFWFALAFIAIAPCMSAIAADGTAADVQAGHIIAIQSLTKGRAACAACHMENGAGQPDVGIPRLAGLDARLIEEQLRYFADGERSSAAMAPYGAALDDTQRRQVSAYFASLPIPPEPDRFAATAAQLSRGRSLYSDGDQRTEMQACAQCHGVTGLGVGQFSPRLAGQSVAYVADQLSRWRAGDIRDPKGAFMRAESRTLSDTDIIAVSAYVAQLGQTP